MFGSKVPLTMTPETDRDIEAIAAAESRTRQIVGRVVLQMIRKQIQVWEEEERTAKRLSLLLGLTFFSVVGLLAIVSYALNAHPKVQLFILAVGIGVIAALGLIMWTRNRKR